MMIENARYGYSDPPGSTIIATVDGVEMHIPADPENRHYQEVVAQGVPIAPYEAHT